MLGRGKSSQESKAGSRKAARIAGVIAAGVILLIGAMLILAQFQSQLSPAAFELILFAATLGALVGMASVLYRLIDGPLPELPTSVPEEMGERHKMRRVALFSLLAWSIAAVVFVLLPGRGGAFAAVFTFLLGFTLLYAFYMVARTRDRNVTTLLAQPWMLWEYDRETWRAFADAQTDPWPRRLGKQTPRLVAGPAGLLTGDKFLPWNKPETYLTKAWSTPAAVVFRFRMSTGKGSLTLDTAAPVMPGAEEDLRRLQERLQSLSLRAEVRLA